MERMNFITGKIVPLPINDLDTDMIIPAYHMTSVAASGYGRFLFERMKKVDPLFPFNLPEYADATIIIGGYNFGCGSSREHAIWSLKEAGITAIIAESFADIFKSNAEKNGLLLIETVPAITKRLIEATAEGVVRLCINLDEQVFSSDILSETVPFECEPFKKHCFLNGYTHLDYLRTHIMEIERHFKSSKPRRYMRLDVRDD